MKKKRYFLFFLTILFAFNFNFKIFSNRLDKNIDFPRIGVINTYAVAGVDDVLIIGGLTITVDTVVKIIASVFALAGTTYVACNYDTLKSKAVSLMQGFAKDCSGVFATVNSQGQRFLKFTKDTFVKLVEYIKKNVGSFISTSTEFIKFVGDKIQYSYDKLSNLVSGTEVWKGTCDFIGSFPTAGYQCAMQFIDVGKDLPKYLWTGYYDTDGDFHTVSSEEITSDKTSVQNDIVPSALTTSNINSDISIPVNYNSKTKVYDVSNTSALEKAGDYVVAGTQAIPAEEEIPSTSTADNNIPILGDIWSLIKKILQAILNLPFLIASAVADSFGWLKDKIEAIPGAVAGSFGWLKDKIEAIPGAVADSFGWLKEKIAAIPGAVADSFGWLKEKIAAIPGAVADSFGWLKEKIAAIPGAISSSISDVLTPVVSFVKNFFGAPSISLTMPTIKHTLTDIFPFCVPFDIYKCLTGFSTSAIAPKFAISVPAWFITTSSIVIDFAQFGVWANIIKIFIYVIFLFALIKLTRRII